MLSGNYVCDATYGFHTLQGDDVLHITMASDPTTVWFVYHVITSNTVYDITLPVTFFNKSSKIGIRFALILPHVIHVLPGLNSAYGFSMIRKRLCSMLYSPASHRSITSSRMWFLGTNLESHVWGGLVSECYQSLTAHQHQKGHTVPKQVITVTTSIQVATV